MLLSLPVEAIQGLVGRAGEVPRHLREATRLAKEARNQAQTLLLDLFD